MPNNKNHQEYNFKDYLEQHLTARDYNILFYHLEVSKNGLTKIINGQHELTARQLARLSQLTGIGTAMLLKKYVELTANPKGILVDLKLDSQ